MWANYPYLLMHTNYLHITSSSLLPPPKKEVMLLLRSVCLSTKLHVTGRWHSTSTDVNYSTGSTVSHPVDTRSPPFPLLSACSIDCWFCCTVRMDEMAWERTTEIVQHLKSVRSKSHFASLISRFRLWAKYSIFDYDSMFDPTLQPMMRSAGTSLTDTHRSQPSHSMQTLVNGHA